MQAKEAGIPHLTKEKGFILKREGSDQVAVLLPSTMPAGMDAEELTRMELETRRQVLYYVEAFKKYLHGMENCELTVIGPAIGFRETRRMKGKEVITADDVLARRKRPDGVARAGWKPEIHKDANKMGEYIEVSEGSWFDVPLGALQCESLDNLLRRRQDGVPPSRQPTRRSASWGPALPPDMRPAWRQPARLCTLRPPRRRCGQSSQSRARFCKIITKKGGGQI